MAVVLVSVSWAAANPPSMPLEAELDLAQQVVTGRISRIQDPNVQIGTGVRWGLATVDVDEVLKGTPAKTIDFLVVCEVGRDYGGSAKLRVDRVGDSGVWLIDSRGRVLQPFGRLDDAREADVRRILKELSQRTWSDPVGGLRAWAAVVHPDYHPNPVILFAVNNVSDADIFVPQASEGGFVTVAAVSSEGNTFDYVLRPMRDGDPNTVFCRKLSPGETVYLHPDYSFIDLKWQQNLGAGKYSVVVSCKNERECQQNAMMGFGAVDPFQETQGTAWKGVLKAAAVELVIAADKPKTKK